MLRRALQHVFAMSASTLAILTNDSAVLCLFKDQERTFAQLYAAMQHAGAIQRTMQLATEFRSLCKDLRPTHIPNCMHHLIIFKNEIEAAASMQNIMEIRRRRTSDDRAILHEAEVRECWNTMMREWLYANLRDDQQKYANNQKRSIFNAVVRKAYGSKYLLMAIWKYGLSWAPHGVAASEHDVSAQIIHCFCKWLKQVATVMQKY